ncbi:alpha/beta fold hydrolase [Viridibacillus arvi]|uniref:alpha/beta fold hydrolase n=1 Tax=Viridibacillus arvi TaxID=263475 RepID=UPI0037F402D5
MLLHTNVSGEGETIVFLHTGLQTGKLDFEYQQAFFYKNYKVISPDLRGHGQSTSNDFTNYFNVSAKDLLETFDHLGLDRVHLVGASLGAIVATVFAKLYPERLSSLIISGITPEKPENWLSLHEQDVAFQSQLLQNEETLAYFNSIHTSDWLQMIYLVRDVNWYPFEITRELAYLNCPTLHLAGEGQINEVKGAINYAQKNKNIHPAIIPFAAHLVHNEQPEVYTILMEQFLTKIKKALK